MSNAHTYFSGGNSNISNVSIDPVLAIDIVCFVFVALLLLSPDSTWALMSCLEVKDFRLKIPLQG